MFSYVIHSVILWVLINQTWNYMFLSRIWRKTLKWHPAKDMLDFCWVSTPPGFPGLKSGGRWKGLGSSNTKPHLVHHGRQRRGEWDWIQQIYHDIPPWKFTCYLKRDHFQRKTAFQPSFFQGICVFGGCKRLILFRPSGPWSIVYLNI